jgi:type II secretory pathway component PulK
MRDFSSDLKELRRRLDEAYSYLNVDAGRIRLSELEVTISAPDLWDDQDRAKKVNAEYANLKGDVAEYDALAASIEDAEVLAELAREEGDESQEPEIEAGITALAKDCQNWDKMAADVSDLKAGKTVSKPIYNHITGALDPNEMVKPTPIVIFEGLHPLVDPRVKGMLDMSVYLDITDDVKFAWKANRDIAERGATMEEVQSQINARLI